MAAVPGEWTPPDGHPAEDVPAVTFVWPDGTRTGICAMPWREGQNVRNYLHTQPLRQYPLLAIWNRCYRYNAKRQKVKLLYIPEPGDYIVLIAAGRPLS